MSFFFLSWEKRLRQEVQRLVQTNEMWEERRKRESYERLIVIRHFCNSISSRMQKCLFYISHDLCYIASAIYVCMYDNIRCMHKRTMILFRENTKTLQYFPLFVSFFFFFITLYMILSYLYRLMEARKERDVFSRNLVSMICYKVFTNKLIEICNWLYVRNANRQ